MGSLGSAMSSPGSAPGTPLGVGFPIRRHSSAFAANRRYSSNALLSPSTAAQVSFDEFFSGFSWYTWLGEASWYSNWNFGQISWGILVRILEGFLRDWSLDTWRIPSPSAIFRPEKWKNFHELVVVFQLFQLESVSSRIPTRIPTRITTKFRSEMQLSLPIKHDGGRNTLLPDPYVKL